MTIIYLSIKPYPYSQHGGIHKEGERSGGFGTHRFGGDKSTIVQCCIETSGEKEEEEEEEEEGEEEVGR